MNDKKYYTVLAVIILFLLIFLPEEILPKGLLFLSEEELEVEIQRFKNDLLKHRFESDFDIDDKLDVLLIENSTGIESIPIEMIHDYYIFKGHVAIYIKGSSNTINIPIKKLPKAV